MDVEGRVQALTDINFELESGQVLGVIGRNGAGKSTLLSLVGGVGLPDSGWARVTGRIGALLELGAGAHPDLSGRDNILVGGVVAGMTRKEVQVRMDEIIEFAELEDFIDSPLRTYSTGMQMRLGFSIVVHSRPHVLLVDEVLSVGDIAFQQKCLRRIERLRKEGCIVVLVTHDLEQAAGFSDRVLWLDGGIQAMLGDPEKVISAYRNQAVIETRARTPEPDTEDATPGGMQSELVLRDNRHGSQEVSIVGVELHDPDGNEIDQIEAGRPLTVLLRYHVSQPVSEGIFGVSISRADGTVCLEVSTPGSQEFEAMERGDGAVAADLFQLDLRPGSYFVDVGIYEKGWQYAYDYHWQVYPLEVTAAKIQKQYRTVPHRWRLPE